MSSTDDIKNEENPSLSENVSYIRLVDALGSNGYNGLIIRINKGDWTVLNELCDILSELYTPPGDETNDDIKGLAAVDIYSLALNKFKVVPTSREDIGRVINLLIKTINTSATGDIAEAHNIIGGLVEIAKLSKTDNVMGIDWDKINDINWVDTVCFYPTEFCFNIIYGNHKAMFKQITNSLGMIAQDTC